MRSEVGTVYVPLVIGAAAITGAVGSTAGDEEGDDPWADARASIIRSRLVLSRAAAAVAVSVALIAVATFGGLLAGIERRDVRR